MFQPMIPGQPPLLQTPRLTLRLFVPGDADALFRLNADPAVVRYTGNVAYASVDEAAAFIASYDQYTLYGMGRLAVCLRPQRTFIGWCGLKNHPEEGFVDLGFRFFQDVWGRGYATEAARACIRDGFERLGLERITGRVLLANVASVRVLEKAGLQRDRTETFHGEPGAVYSIDRNREITSPAAG